MSKQKATESFYEWEERRWKAWKRRNTRNAIIATVVMVFAIACTLFLYWKA